MIDKKYNPIGTHFNKDKIFVGTIEPTIDEVYEDVVKTYPYMSREAVGFLIKTHALQVLASDIFYLTRKGFTRFTLAGNETYKGDGSDKKGRIINVEPVWNYYRPDQLIEIKNNGKKQIFVSTLEPLDEYQKKYYGEEMQEADSVTPTL